MAHNLWKLLTEEAWKVSREEPLLASYVHNCILNHDNLDAALSFILANKIADSVMPAISVRELFTAAYADDERIIKKTAYDIEAVYARDPAIRSYLTILLNLKGFQSIQVHRLAHYLWRQKRYDLALFIQSRNSETFGVDIHPASQIGKGVMFDHATGIVVGETAVIEDNVSIMQSVTLGGTGNDTGDRHPKVRTGVMIGSGAKVLGNIEIGACSKVGAGSVVVRDVPPRTTVVGIPAVVVSESLDTPCETMNQDFLSESL